MFKILAKATKDFLEASIRTSSWPGGLLVTNYFTKKIVKRLCLHACLLSQLISHFEVNGLNTV